MMESPQSKDPQKADPLADALERLERSVANREKARIASLVDSGLDTREKESENVYKGGGTKVSIEEEVLNEEIVHVSHEPNKKNSSWARAICLCLTTMWLLRAPPIQT